MKRTMDGKIFGMGYQHLQHLKYITLRRLVLEPMPMQLQHWLKSTLARLLHFAQSIDQPSQSCL